MHKHLPGLAYVTCANVFLAKVSHVVKPKVSVEGTTQGPGNEEMWFTWGHLQQIFNAFLALYYCVPLGKSLYYV